METNKVGENLGEFVGTVAWLWIFYRFRQDGAVLLGLSHPWEHGHDDHDSHSDHGKGIVDETKNWLDFVAKAVIPGDEDDDDDEGDDDDEDDDEDVSKCNRYTREFQ